ncbi:MAG: hypothetical protein WCX22_09540 [Methanoregula sp.]
MRIPPSGLTDPGLIIIYALLIVSLSVLVSVIPAVVIFTGGYRGKPIFASLFGLLLLPAMAVAGYIVNPGKAPYGSITAAGALVFLALPSLLAGCAGYCSALRTKPALALAIVMGGAWVVIIIHAFN